MPYGLCENLSSVMTSLIHADSVNEITSAYERIRDIVRETPVEQSRYLTLLANCEVLLKLEHLQHTGSFKFRGAVSKITSLSNAQLRNGVVAASMGNHGLAVARAAQMRGVPAEIYLPKIVSPSKAQMIESFGARVIFYGDNCIHAETRARNVAKETGNIFVSPYNDLKVIAGQGTIGVELLRQLPAVKSVYVACGGGGLIAGIGTYLKAMNPEIEIVGCWPENSRVLYESLRAGCILDFPEQPTYSESTAGGIEQDSITLPICKEVIDRFVLVSETEIRDAMRMLLAQEHWLVEGAAGVAAAAFLKGHKRHQGEQVAILLCGRNISQEVLAALC
jgi:threonine dehydratase